MMWYPRAANFACLLLRRASVLARWKEVADLMQQIAWWAPSIKHCPCSCADALPTWCTPFHAAGVVVRSMDPPCHRHKGDFLVLLPALPTVQGMWLHTLPNPLICIFGYSYPSEHSGASLMRSTRTNSALRVRLNISNTSKLFGEHILLVPSSAGLCP